MAKRQASLLSFCQSTHKRQREAEDDQYQESDDSDRQDVQLKIAQMNLNIHIMIHQI